VGAHSCATTAFLRSRMAAARVQARAAATPFFPEIEINP
jgi:hypothetical protein